jgi:hypothetical protein
MPDIPFRIAELERRFNKLEDRAEDVPVLRAEYALLAQAVKDLAEETKTLRRSIVLAAFSFALSVVGTGAALIITRGWG